MVSQVTDLVLMSKDPLLLQIHRDVSGGTSEIKNLGTLPNVGLAAPGMVVTVGCVAKMCVSQPLS
jgi:hypothetical protein